MSRPLFVCARRVCGRGSLSAVSLLNFHTHAVTWLSLVNLASLTLHKLQEGLSSRRSMLFADVHSLLAEPSYTCMHVEMGSLPILMVMEAVHSLLIGRTIESWIR